MRNVSHAIKGLSRARQLVLVGAGIGMLAVLMPWHTVGTAVLGTEHSYNGFGDQNMIVGIITFALMFASLAAVGLPAIGLGFLKTGWRLSSMLVFFGGEAALLVLVLTVMHATSLTRAANYDLRLGIHLALIGSCMVFIGGYLLKNEERAHHGAHSEPLAHLPRSGRSRHHASPHHIDLSREEEAEHKKDDSRMQLDI